MVKDRKNKILSFSTLHFEKRPRKFNYGRFDLIPLVVRINDSGQCDLSDVFHLEVKDGTFCIYLVKEILFLSGNFEVTGMIEWAQKSRLKQILRPFYKTPKSLCTKN